MTMGVFPPLVRVGPTYVPGTTGCPECQETAYRRKYPHFDRGDGGDCRRTRRPRRSRPSCGIIGSLAANEVIAHLTGLHPRTCEGRAFMIDLTTLAVTHRGRPRWSPAARVRRLRAAPASAAGPSPS